MIPINLAYFLTNGFDKKIGCNDFINNNKLAARVTENDCEIENSESGVDTRTYLVVFRSINHDSLYQSSCCVLSLMTDDIRALIFDKTDKFRGTL